jgi:hypothetical protein
MTSKPRLQVFRRFCFPFFLARKINQKKILVRLAVLAKNIRYFYRAWPQVTSVSKMESLIRRELIIAKYRSIVFHQPTSDSRLEREIDAAISRDLIRLENLRDLDPEMHLLPISFSWPGEIKHHERAEIDLSPIIPWEPYSFESYPEYLREYSKSHYALTFKKGGWDCNRHIEIMASGSIPIMPDIEDCPRMTMFFYPKNLMSFAKAEFENESRPTLRLHQAISQWLARFQLSSAMARQVIQMARIAPSHIVFADPGFERRPDYLSSQLFSGFKQLMGSDAVLSLFQSDILYSDYEYSTDHLHGKGFGSTKILEPQYKETNRQLNASVDFENLGSNVAVIVGDVGNNRRIAEKLFASKGDFKRVALWSSDFPPDREERIWLRGLGATIFSREHWK